MAAIRCISACRVHSNTLTQLKQGPGCKTSKGILWQGPHLSSQAKINQSWAPSPARLASPAKRCRAQHSVSKAIDASRQQYLSPKALLRDGGSQRQADISASAACHLGQADSGN